MAWVSDRLGSNGILSLPGCVILSQKFAPQFSHLLIPPASVGDTGFDPWVRKIPWRRKWQPTPVFLPGKSQGQRSLAGYSPWGHKESDTT